MAADHLDPTYGLRSEANLLIRFEGDAETAGLVGEKKNAKIILLAAASAKLPKPLNVNVGGASSAGKNHLLGTVARFIPHESKRIITGMSPKALMHAKEDEYQHKAIFVAEYEGVSGADFAVRTMQSEQTIEWEYVESSSKGIEKKTKKVNGPAAFIQATTRVTLHPENETRLLNIQMDETEDQTHAIMVRQGKQAALGTPPVPEGLYGSWNELIRGLTKTSVRIPFAPQLAEEFPAARVRSRRDFPKLLGLIEVSAFLHQHLRPNDAEGNIIAVPQDYLNAKELFEHCYYAGPESKVGELIQAAERLAGTNFSVTDLVRETGWRKSKTYDVLGRAEELGCIGEGDKRGCYRLVRKYAEAPLNLPSKIKLKAEDFRISSGIAPTNFRISNLPGPDNGGTLGGKTEFGMSVSIASS